MSDSALMPTYNRLPVTFERGKGVRLWDTEGKEYLDAISGIAVCNLGHSHPKISTAICGQADELMHTSNLFGIANQERLGTALCEAAGMDKAFFCNSGAEANEAAIKIARLYGHNKGIEKPAIVVMENAFHGRTMATLSATGNRKAQAGFEPLVQGFVRVPYDDLDSIRALAEHNPDIVAIMVEPIQGEGGVNIPDEQYLTNLRAICDDNEWLLILDEIQTGMGRTGRLFSHQHQEIIPDVMTLAKGLGNGFPVGACLAKGQASELFGPGSHGTTFGGNPLACRVALSVIETMNEDDLPAKAAALGKQLIEDFQKELAEVEGVTDIRGSGLMIGIELDRTCTDLVTQALDEGLIINVTASQVIRLLPPLVLSTGDTEELVAGLTSLIKDFLAQD